MPNSFVRSLKVALVCALISLPAAAAERLKPFVLASTSPDPVTAIAGETRERLIAHGFSVIGEYQPYEDAAVLVFTSEELQTTAAQTELGAFGAVLRAAVTRSGDQTQTSYVNPAYLAQAYRLDNDLQGIQAVLAEALGAETTFGSKKGLAEKKLNRYRYMFGMERFEDTYDLGTFDSQALAVEAVDARLQDNTLGITQVYRLELPEQDAVLYGVAMQPEGEEHKYYNDAYQMSVVDFADLRSTAYLPYEVLVKDGVVQALHMRFRMAVHFPDLSMMGKHSFMTLMPSPKAIGNALSGLVAP